MRRKVVPLEDIIKVDTARARKPRALILKSVLQELPAGLTVEDVKYAFIECVLERNSWNRTATAIELGLNYSTIMAMIKDGYISGGRRATGRPPHIGNR